MSDDAPEPRWTSPGWQPPVVRPPTFGDVLWTATPRAWAAYAILAANVVVFAIMVVRGVHAQEPLERDLVRWGANFGPAVRTGEWWRLATSMFLHGGWLHVAMNMYGLYAIGPFVERLFGNAAFLALYLVAGLFGSLASVVTHVHPPVVSVGASGAIFGILGGLAGYLARHGRTSVPRAVVRGLTGNVLTVIALNVAIGLTIPQIDNSAHLGGLVSGFLLGFGLAMPLSPAGVARRRRRAAIVTVLGVAAVVAACVIISR